jgi:hypothetical protein
LVTWTYISITVVEDKEKIYENNVALFKISSKQWIP